MREDDVWQLTLAGLEKQQPGEAACFSRFIAQKRRARRGLDARWTSNGAGAMGGTVGDDGVVDGGEREIRLGGEQEKGNMRVPAETCRAPRYAAKRPLFFFSLSLPLNFRYGASVPLCNVDSNSFNTPEGLALTVSMEPVFSCNVHLYLSEISAVCAIRMGTCTLLSAQPGHRE